MKTFSILAIATLSIAAAGSAFAQEASFHRPQPVTSDISRAQVRAQLSQARADGTLPFGQAGVVPVRQARSDLTRAEVRAQTLMAIADGQANAFHGEAIAFGNAASTPASTELAAAN